MESLLFIGLHDTTCDEQVANFNTYLLRLISRRSICIWNQESRSKWNLFLQFWSIVRRRKMEFVFLSIIYDNMWSWGIGIGLHAIYSWTLEGWDDSSITKLDMQHHILSWNLELSRVMLLVSTMQELQYVFGKYRGGFDKSTWFACELQKNII